MFEQLVSFSAFTVTHELRDHKGIKADRALFYANAAEAGSQFECRSHGKNTQLHQGYSSLSHRFIAHNIKCFHYIRFIHTFTH